MFLMCLSSVEAETFAVAGVPMGLAVPRDYDVIFSQLKDAGIKAFFPVFQYVEAPTAETLG